MSELQGDLDSVEEEVTVISTEQILQDGRILELEIDADGMNYYESMQIVIPKNRYILIVAAKQWKLK